MFINRRFGTKITNNAGQFGQQDKPGGAKLPPATASLNVFYDMQEATKSAAKAKTLATQSRQPLAVLPLPTVDQLATEIDSMSIEMEDDGIIDIDEYDRDDPQFVTEYVEDIFSYLKAKERELQLGDYMTAIQLEIKPRHRNLLVAWMTQVYHQLRLLSETLMLAVRIVDRTLSARPVARKKLQLVGVGALIIASKFEEMHCPPLSDFKFCSDFAYTEEEMLRIERILLNTLGFNLCLPSPLLFLRRYSKAAGSDSTTHTLSKYLTELSCLDYNMLQFSDSMVAAAAVFLARRMRGISPTWDRCLEYYTDYAVEDFLDCAAALNAVYFREASAGIGALFKKYSDKRLLYVSQTPYLPL